MQSMTVGRDAKTRNLSDQFEAQVIRKLKAKVENQTPYPSEMRNVFARRKVAGKS
jgi:hypothetical protein